MRRCLNLSWSSGVSGIRARISWPRRAPLTLLLYPLFMVHHSPDVALHHLLQLLPPRPYQKDELDQIVSEVLQDKPSKFSQDVLRGQWELALKNEIFTLAVRAVLSVHNAWYLTRVSDERGGRTQ
jgi:hypothetical protein